MNPDNNDNNDEFDGFTGDRGHGHVHGQGFGVIGHGLVNNNANDSSNNCCGSTIATTTASSDNEPSSTNNDIINNTNTTKQTVIIVNNNKNDQHSALPPLSPEEKDLCHKAIELFESGDYAECSTIFADILSNRLSDYRLSHNLIVSSFWQNNCRDLQGTFLPQLLGILDEASISLENICSEGIVHPVLLHNLAVVYYFDGQYKKSLDIVDKLLKSLPNSSSILIKRLRLLKVDLLVQLQSFDEALLEIQRVEKKGSGSSSSSTSPSDSRSSSTEDLGLLISTSNDQAKDKEPKKFVADYSIRFRFKLQECKTRCLLCMKNLSSARKEYKVFGAMLSGYGFGCGISFGGGTNASNHSAQIRPTGINFKAYHNYLKGNIRKGLNTLSLLLDNYTESHFMETGDNLNVIYNNNAGCCHYALGKPLVSAFFFQKASQEINKPEYKDRHNLPLHCLGFNRKFEIMYNFGVSLLNAKNLAEAFNCLSICSKQYPSNPRLWLRLAECCIDISKCNESIERNPNSTFAFNPDANFNQFSSDSIMFSIDIEKPIPTLGYGLYCTEQGIKLVDSELIRKNHGILFVPPSNPMRDITEINTLRASLYCAGAYVSLRLKYYPHCISLCQQLIGMSSLAELPNAYVYLAKMYLGKALLKQDEPNLIKALEIYNDIKDFDPRHYCVQNIGNNIRAYTSSPCYSQSPSATEVTSNISPISSSTGGGQSQRFREYKPASDWYPENELAAQTDVVHNQILILTKLGRLPEAVQLMESWKSRLVSSGIMPPKEFTYLEAYVCFVIGNTPRAKQLMTHNQHGLT